MPYNISLQSLTQALKQPCAAPGETIIQFRDKPATKFDVSLSNLHDSRKVDYSELVQWVFSKTKFSIADVLERQYPKYVEIKGVMKDSKIETTADQLNYIISELKNTDAWPCWEGWIDDVPGTRNVDWTVYDDATGRLYPGIQNPSSPYPRFKAVPYNRWVTEKVTETITGKDGKTEKKKKDIVRLELNAGVNDTGFITTNEYYTGLAIIGAALLNGTRWYIVNNSYSYAHRYNWCFFKKSALTDLGRIADVIIMQLEAAGFVTMLYDDDGALSRWEYIEPRWPLGLRVAYPYTNEDASQLPGMIHCEFDSVLFYKVCPGISISGSKKCKISGEVSLKDYMNFMDTVQIQVEVYDGI
jgi:hypothetical protein